MELQIQSLENKISSQAPRPSPSFSPAWCLKDENHRMGYYSTGLGIMRVDLPGLVSASQD